VDPASPASARLPISAPPLPREEGRTSPLLRVAVGVGKSSGWLSRRLGRGGGTTLPGYLAERIDPDLLAEFARRIPNGAVLVSGTNGKTTSTRILTDALERAGLAPITNRQGSNLSRGLAATLLGHADLRGRLQVADTAIGVFEVDEGALPAIAEVMQPRLILITNLFRDQLDRYFEVDYVASLWSRAFTRLPDTTVMVLNADDPQVARLGEAGDRPTLYFGIEDARVSRPELDHTSDARRCALCSVDLAYSSTYYAHLGHYACPKCGWRRPQPRVSAWRVDVQGVERSRVVASTPWGDQELAVPLPGLHNVYNALSAAAAAFALGVEAQAVRDAVAGARPAFGRLERFSVDGRNVCLALVKNPSGFNQMLRLLAEGNELRGPLMLALNDHGPDGRDVSWIWDVDLDLCRGRTTSFVVSGRRAHDMALRLKLAGCLASPDRAGVGGGGGGAPAELVIEGDVVRAFWQALDRVKPEETLYVLPTYTAMWTLRTELTRRGYVAPFWKH
jgi:UDP-N-acetylmuramyl tripeptide synthase